MVIAPSATRLPPFAGASMVSDFRDRRLGRGAVGRPTPGPRPFAAGARPPGAAVRHTHHDLRAMRILSAPVDHNNAGSRARARLELPPFALAGRASPALRATVFVGVDEYNELPGAPRLDRAVGTPVGVVQEACRSELNIDELIGNKLRRHCEFARSFQGAVGYRKSECRVFNVPGATWSRRYGRRPSTGRVAPCAKRLTDLRTVVSATVKMTLIGIATGDDHDARSPRWLSHSLPGSPSRSPGPGRSPRHDVQYAMLASAVSYLRLQIGSDEALSLRDSETGFELCRGDASWSLGSPE